MAETLILDSEAVNALAQATSRGTLAARARAILTVAHEKRALIRVPAAVLSEVCRGPRYDSAIHHLLNGRGIGVSDLTRPIAERAGNLLARAGLSSEHAVDAFVVATALQFAPVVIATGDPDDIRRIASPFRHVRIFALMTRRLRGRVRRRLPGSRHALIAERILNAASLCEALGEVGQRRKG